jgi:hypothetical protein
MICYYQDKRKGVSAMRMSEGRETFNRLLNWDRGQAPSERLAAIILSKEGFNGVDPSHPLGGKDGLKDMTLSSDGKRWIGAVYFPRGQQSFPDIKKKFAHDLDGVKANNAEGLAFVTNQELRLGERKILTELMPEVDVQIYHLERIASLLNTPSFYGIRMEFLDIEMSKEEQLSFFADQDQRLVRIEGTLAQMAIGIDGYKTLLTSTPPKQQTNDEDEEWDEFFEEPRSMDEIANMVNEFCEKVWFDRHLSLRYKVENGLETVDPQIWAGALKSAERVIQQYGEENLGPYSDFEWGMLNGKLSALRWVMGEDWDELYT